MNAASPLHFLFFSQFYIFVFSCVPQKKMTRASGSQTVRSCARALCTSGQTRWAPDPGARASRRPGFHPDTQAEPCSCGRDSNERKKKERRRKKKQFLNNFFGIPQRWASYRQSAQATIGPTPLPDAKLASRSGSCLASARKCAMRADSKY